MKQILLSIAFLLPAFCMGQQLNNGLWKIRSSAIIVDGDTTYLFKQTQAENLFDLSQISYQFSSDGTYAGTSVNGTPMGGTWIQQAASITIDSVTSKLDLNNSSEFFISAPLIIKDTSGYTKAAVSLLQFFAISASDNIQISIFPNPFDKLIHVKIISPKAFSAAIEIKDFLGQTVYSRAISDYGPKSEFSIALGFLSRGTYLFVINGDGVNVVKKIIKL